MADRNTTPPEHFLDALKRRNLEGKRDLIADLKRRRSDKALEILVDLLEDESWYLRELAVDALSDASEEAVPRLQALMGTGLWYTRSAAARVLGKMGHVESLPKLVELLEEPNATVREAAMASIADLVHAGQARETALLFWKLGRRRSEEWKRALLSAHPKAGGLVAEHLEDPSAFLAEVERPLPEARTPEPDDSVDSAKKA